MGLTGLAGVPLAAGSAGAGSPPLAGGGSVGGHEAPGICECEGNREGSGAAWGRNTASDGAVAACGLLRPLTLATIGFYGEKNRRTVWIGLYEELAAFQEFALQEKSSDTCFDCVGLAVLWFGRTTMRAICQRTSPVSQTEATVRPRHSRPRGFPSFYAPDGHESTAGGLQDLCEESCQGLSMLAVRAPPAAPAPRPARPCLQLKCRLSAASLATCTICAYRGNHALDPHT